MEQEPVKAYEIKQAYETIARLMEGGPVYFGFDHLFAARQFLADMVLTKERHEYQAYLAKQQAEREQAKA